jgi:hypothetical protein
MLLMAVILVGCGPQAGALDEVGTQASSVEEPQVVPPPRVWGELAVQPRLSGIPCDVRQVLETSCAGCHAGVSPYIHSFVTRDDFLAPQGDGTTFGQRMVARMAETQQPMPPLGVSGQPTAQDEALVAAWVAAGMPGGACGDLTPP